MVGISRVPVVSTRAAGLAARAEMEAVIEDGFYYWPTLRALWPRNARWLAGGRTEATHAGNAPRGHVRAGIGEAQ